MNSIHKFFHNHYHRHYHGQYGHARKLFVIDLILLISAIVVFIGGLFFFFWKPGIQEWIDLKISFGENRLKSGEPVAITINYTNRSKFNINDISLAMHLPPGFVVDRERTPENEFNNNSILNLLELPAGAKGQKIIYGMVWVEPKTEVDITALMSYRAENSKTREQKYGLFILNLPESVLRGELVLAATSTLADNTVPFTYKIKNTGPEPVTTNIDTKWNNTNDIIPDADYVIVPGIETIVTGTLKMPRLAGNYPLQIKTQAIVNGQQITQLTDTTNLEVYEPRVAVSATFPAGRAFAEAGQTLPVEIYWKNNSAFNLTASRLRVRATPGTIDWPATARENNLTADNDGLVITATNRTALSVGAPGASDRFTINLKLLSRLQLNGQEKVFLEITPTITATLAEVPRQDFIASGSSAKILLATEILFTAQTRYYTDEGDQLGRGPLPPQVGETTKYWVFIQAKNTTNPTKNAAFSATLAPGVEFTGKQSITIGVPLKFEPNSRAITWNESALPSHSHTGLYFEVAVNPTPEQIGKDIAILKNIKFTATDSVTGKQFNLSAPNITNRLPASDPGANKI